MPIKQSKYVDIKSGINNIRTATEKELIARIFTTSASLTQNVVECENLEEVADIFATSSDEYKIASKYFSFINKYARSPRKISFAKDLSAGAYSSLAGTVTLTYSTDGQTIKNAMASSSTMTVTINGTATEVSVGGTTITSSDIDGVGSAVAENLNTNFETEELDITCEYSSGKFTFTSGTKAKQTIAISGTVADAIKVSSTYNPNLTEGYEAGYDNAFDSIYQANNNFATFVFLGLTDSTEIATLAGYVAQNYPSEFMMVVPVTSSNYTTIQSAVANINGVSLELCGDTEDTGKFNFVMPMSITATTDYNKENGTVNYMYMQDNNMKVVVDDDSSATTYDNVKVNYYGRTQQAGQKLAFYQNGVLQGNYQDQNIYVNEIWLKDALSTKFLNYMLLTSNWYANKSGQAIGQGLVVDIIDRAKLNGTITTEKEISEEDKVYIYNVTADENAWRQIYELGYYLITSISKVTTNNQETYQFNYTLLYSKGDSIKKVEGQNILI